MITDPETILNFWFEGDATARRKKWFEKNDGFDAACAAFVPVLRAARDGGFDAWSAQPKSALALILVLDQLPRNVFRGLAEAFAADPHAREIARRAVECGHDLVLTPVERMFLYLPFEHSERLADQDLSVRLFETLRGDLGEETIDYARRHRDVIREFGRFPHRNAALGRVNTAEEVNYLARSGAGF